MKNADIVPLSFLFVTVSCTCMQKLQYCNPRTVVCKAEIKVIWGFVGGGGKYETLLWLLQNALSQKSCPVDKTRCPLAEREDSWNDLRRILFPVKQQHTRRHCRVWNAALHLRQNAYLKKNFLSRSCKRLPLFVCLMFGCALSWLIVEFVACEQWLTCQTQNITYGPEIQKTCNSKFCTNMNWIAWKHSTVCAA